MEVHVLVAHVHFQDVGAFIVKMLKTWSETGLDEDDVSFCAGFEDGFFGPVFHWFGMDVVGVLVAEHKEALVALAGRKGLVCEDLTGGWSGFDGCAAEVSAVVGWF